MNAQPAPIRPAPLIGPDDVPYLPRGVRLADGRTVPAAKVFFSYAHLPAGDLGDIAVEGAVESGVVQAGEGLFALRIPDQRMSMQRHAVGGGEGLGPVRGLDPHLAGVGVEDERGGRRFLVQRHGTLDILRGRLLSTLFYEESTRTSSSFEAAMLRCGGQVVSINTSRSSVAKGETLVALVPLDTVMALGTAHGVVKRVRPEWPLNRQVVDAVALKDGDAVVGVRQGRVTALSFHPEENGDARVHAAWLESF